MKKIIFSLIIFLSICQGCGSSDTSNDSQNGYSNNPNNNYQDNSAYPEYNVDDLNQYGYWQDIYPYGRCWRPSVVDNWSPFSNGHWVYDGNDWVWVSYEPFGWIVYHYGTWENTPDQGWIWIPSDEAWSPARVQWIYYGDQVGWAPLRPNNRQWPEPWENNSDRYWNVVRMQDFTNENVHTYRISNPVQRDQTSRIEHRPPEVKVVEHFVRHPIPIVKINRVPIKTQVPIPNQQSRNDNPRKVNPSATNNNPPPKQRNGRQIYNIQIPPKEKEKVDRNRPQVERNVLVKKDQKQPPNNQKSKNTEKPKKTDSK